MIETPAAAVISDRLAKVVDFFSIGTNDLTQYTLACDRQNNDLGRFFNAHHPAVLRLIKMACDNAHKEGIWCGICGELGADLDLTETFLSIGVDELSVSPRSVLPLRQKVREAKKMCEQVKKELTEEGKPFSDEVDVGIMIETPAAAIISDRLAKVVDFFSIGTNDLTQYTLACDRQNNDLGRFFNAHHPAVLRLIKMVAANAHKEGIWCGICGELGADLELTETFLSIGVDELSVSPRAVLPLRQKVRETVVADVKDKIVAELMGDEVAL